ncbi:histidine phosphatase family protein [Candidatus Woesearchaeota archaeon]|nr:histidine phosphatase family protein [Candidatus Woesearchaeota archaeon]
MKVYIIRHGETTGDVENRYGGDYDDHLTDKGKQQSTDLAEKLRGKGIQRMFYSPRHRARETAGILAKALDVVMIEVPDLRERNHYGILTGLVKSEALAKYPEEVAKLKAAPLHHHVKNSEAYEAFRDRVVRAFDECIGQPYDTIAIVSHGGPIKCFIREVLKLGEMKDLADCAYIELERVGTELTWTSADGAELIR